MDYKRGHLSTDIICSEKRTVFRKRSSRETVSYEEQIMSKDKYPSIFSPQMETIVFIILQIFFATRAVLKIEEYSRIFPSFSWGIFGHVTRLDQSRASVKIWWIIKRGICTFLGRYLYSTKCSWIITLIIIVRVGKQISFEARTSMEVARIFIFRAFSIFVSKAVSTLHGLYIPQAGENIEVTAVPKRA